MRSTEGSKSGFTLLETLIAFSVFSLFIIAVHKSFVTGIKAQDAANWSNEIGQVVRSEFSLIEAGLIPGRTYSKRVFQRFQLEIKISDLVFDRTSFSINEGFLQLATIEVEDIDEGVSNEFKKIIFVGKNRQ